MAISISDSALLECDKEIDLVDKHITPVNSL